MGAILFACFVFAALPARAADPIQKLLHDRTVFAPIWENGFIRGVGPRVEEPALALIPFYPYSAPYEDLRLKP